MHVGRIAHPHNRKTDEKPVGPSAIAPEFTQMYTDRAGMQSIPTPRALEANEVPAVIGEKDPEQTYAGLVRELNRFALAYLHVGRFSERFDVHATLRPLFNGPYLAGGGLLSAADGVATLDRYGADAVVYGQRVIANPDLVYRLQSNAPLADADPLTFYTPGPEGFVDYAPLEQAP